MNTDGLKRGSLTHHTVGKGEKRYIASYSESWCLNYKWVLPTITNLIYSNWESLSQFVTARQWSCSSLLALASSSYLTHHISRMNVEVWYSSCKASYSGKLRGENFREFRGFVAIHESFLCETWGHGILGTVKASNPRKFSPQKLSIHKRFLR